MHLMKILIFGHKGWIASYVVAALRQERDVDVVCAADGVRVDDVKAVTEQLDMHKPDRVVCLVGRTHGDGIGSIDYLEQPGKLVENIRDNLFSPIALAMVCSGRGIHMTYLGTGCIFDDPLPSTCIPFKENDSPNYFGSSYSIVKGFTDRLMHMLQDSVLNVRIRMPITDDFHPRNFIIKISRYPKICSVPNSCTVIPSVMPMLVDMIKTSKVGTINLTNPGYMSHDQILSLYRDYVDAGLRWENIGKEEHDAMLLSKRSNNVLDTTLLQSWYPDVPNLTDAVTECISRMAAKKKLGQV